MLSCEHDDWSNFDFILTGVGYVVRIVKISVEFVDGLSSSKGCLPWSDDKDTTRVGPPPLQTNAPHQPSHWAGRVGVDYVMFHSSDEMFGHCDDLTYNSPHIRETSVESGFEHGTFRPRSRDMATSAEFPLIRLKIS
ncbi:hypothetical protein AVEN_60974-1 [Araneus ventricosus]|uniref:Uncharacterized protein n=1 Tax=Araneus ventricosus TaxID=182803 RepID=A0A4Y2DDP3_ARAVE|nr:hypothetical protein AVEN_60974-1 [Araneus ventricosus]